MAEENTNPVVENTDVPASASADSPAQPDYSDTEKRAMSQGWVPEDQYEGNGKWRPAEEFLDRGELFAKIDDLHRRNKGMESTVHELRKHYKMVRETEYRRALSTLKAQKAEALDNADSMRVVEIDEQIAATKATAAREINDLSRPAPVATQVDPTLQVWINRNPWYESNRAMRAFADVTGEELAHSGMSNPVEILQEIERRAKKEFPNQFTNPNRERSSAVEGGGAKKTKNDSFQLSVEETTVMNKLIQKNVLTKEQYIKDIKEARGIQ